MVTREELINRRVGRMEALAHDLSQVKPGYQPTELEIDRGQALYAALGEFLGMTIMGMASKPQPEAEGEAKARPAPAAKSGKK